MTNSTTAPDSRKADPAIEAKPGRRKKAKPSKAKARAAARNESLGLHPDFPLFPHNNGQWARKIKRKAHYFGSVASDPKGEAALQLWLKQKDYLIAGQRPPVERDGLSVGELCDRYLQSKDEQLKLGTITPLTRKDCEAAAVLVVEKFGSDRLVSDLGPSDFDELRAALVKRGLALVTIGNHVNRIRGVFLFAKRRKLIAEPPFGEEFCRPTRKQLKVHRTKQEAKIGKKLFTAADVQSLLASATPQLKAMILLGINCGFGNNDCASLPLAAVDLAGAWVTFPRPKTAVSRKCPLWPETVEALQSSLASRRLPRDPDAHGHLFFITAARGAFAKDSTDNPISKEFAKLAAELKLSQRGRGFYSLRHTFRTVAGGSKDLEATRAIMGHSNEHVEETYIHFDDDERLRAVSDHVRNWLFPKPAVKPATADKRKRKAKPRKPNTKRPAERKAPVLSEGFQLRIVG